MDRRAWQATVWMVAKNQRQLVISMTKHALTGIEKKCSYTSQHGLNPFCRESVVVATFSGGICGQAVKDRGIFLLGTLKRATCACRQLWSEWSSFFQQDSLFLSKWILPNIIKSTWISLWNLFSVKLTTSNVFCSPTSSPSNFTGGTTCKCWISFFFFSFLIQEFLSRPAS